MANTRRAGRLQFYVGGELIDVKGDVTYSLGGVNRSAVVGADRVHGFQEELMVPYVEGKATDRGDFDVVGLRDLTDTTVQLVLASGKTIIFNNAWFAGEGDISAEEGEISIRFEALGAEEQLAEA